MQAISIQKFIRMSPQKLRLVADMVRGKGTSEVLEFLPFVKNSYILKDVLGSDHCPIILELEAKTL